MREGAERERRAWERWWERGGFQSVEEVFIIQYVCGQEELCNEEQILPNHRPLLTTADHYTQWALTILDLFYLQVNRVRSHFGVISLYVTWHQLTTSSP